MTVVARSADRLVKRARLLELLGGRGAEGLILSSHAAVTWYLDGARTHVSLMGDPVAAVVVRPGGDEIRVFENEAERMLAEELHPDDAAHVTRVPWHEPLLPVLPSAPTPPVAAAPVAQSAVAARVGSREGAARLGLISEGDVATELRAARASLLPGELGRYRRLGAEVAEVLTDVALAVTPGSSEREAAAVLAGALVARGIDPVVVLVSGDARVRHRHPLPTDGPLGRRAMLVVCGRRHGLIANATRWVAWEPAVGPDAEAAGGRGGGVGVVVPAGDAGAAGGRGGGAGLVVTNGASRSAVGDTERRVLEVEARFFDATVPGATVGEVFAAGVAAYAEAGFEAGEWRRHHQGGPTGYAGRDPRATFGVDDVVQENHAFAWNPSAPGAKVEDTVLVTSAGIEPLTDDPRWPVEVVAGRRRPVALRR
ncbi:peptidase M24 [Herbiconiux sp. CPCC 205716]|uniref:Peptidase M24 n=1 Tax=Herbiconiux gentiana TaxID=2970912 RepID=A0ABT2GLX7_9MICO|nr:peptidase M24 [Herbiconiux gentiana]MCS5716265.1 peptidase M24 [Herbiconiux gentiana]